MQTTAPSPPPPGTSDPDHAGSGDEAGQIAGGSGILFLGGLTDKGLRLVQTWFLSRYFGAEPFGLYTYLTTVASVATTVTPLGMDQGAMVFGARYLRTGEKDRLKGTLLAGVWISCIAGLLLNGLLFGLARWGPWWVDDPERQQGLQAISLVMMPGTLITFLSGIQRGYKDMRGFNLAVQVALPALLLTTSMLTTWSGLGVPGVIHAFTVANAITAAYAIYLAWPLVRPVLADPTLRPRWEIGTLLGYSIPQSLTLMVFRLVQWMDILMLSWLGTLEQVGLYRVAVSIALIGSLPMVAITTTLSPYIAELAYVKELDRLNRILHQVTRWLFILIVPIYLVMLLLPDLCLEVFGPGYEASRASLIVLLAGQAFHMVTSPTTRMIPMAGYAVLNLVNGVAALALNATLCWLFIPTWGSVGAALATAVTLLLWDVARVIQVWYLLRCGPFDRRTGLLVVAALVCGGAGWALGLGHGYTWRIAVTFLSLTGFAMAVAAFGRTPEDAEIVQAFRARILRLLGRRATPAR